MGRFKESEKVRQARVKKSSNLFSTAAKARGDYNGIDRDFCLPVKKAHENLFDGIRPKAIDYFKRQGINWHKGKHDNPSNHLCDSQVCCANFLLPFNDNPGALKALLQPVFPGISKMLPMELLPPDETGELVAFEWIGLKNYLGEKERTPGKRTRGANFTSADAAVRFEREDKKKQIVLIEWKYTESYSSTSYKVSKSKTDRSKIYRPLYDRSDCPVDKKRLPDYDDLFYEPFYQFFRQQLLANEMEKVGELDADIVSVLHIAPAHNGDFRKITSPGLQALQSPRVRSATKVWEKLVKKPDRFVSVSTEELFGAFPIHRFKGLQGWCEYVRERYSMVV